MPFPWLPGMLITDTRLNEGAMQLVTQASDQIVTNSTAYVNSQITFTPAVNAVYAYWLLISYSAHESADFRWRWDAPQADFASFTQARHTDATGTFNAPASVIFRRPANSTDRIAGGGGTTDISSFFSAYDQGTFITTSSPAAVTMQFTQYTANTGQTILRGGNQTRMLYQRIG
ncbi:hypothetical protein [Streptomyces macrosporus]|uniref:Uncharacterized protein n=1 Tax=Streptomyces macrosporus TaxID=44032 RepID=A0ABP5XIE5_9ACTN